MKPRGLRGERPEGCDIAGKPCGPSVSGENLANVGVDTGCFSAAFQSSKAILPVNLSL